MSRWGLIKVGVLHIFCHTLFLLDTSNLSQSMYCFRMFIIYVGYHCGYERYFGVFIKILLPLSNSFPIIG